MASHVARERGVNISGDVELLAQRDRDDPIGKSQPASVYCVGAVRRQRFGDAFAPRFRPVGVGELDKKNSSLADSSRRRLERLYERKSDLSERDTVEPDHSGSSACC
jgi:hypothetical protein